LLLFVVTETAWHCHRRVVTGPGDRTLQQQWLNVPTDPIGTLLVAGSFSRADIVPIKKRRI
jgi:hypothetical protein